MPTREIHDVLIALDESLDLNNGQPSLWAFLVISNIPPDPRKPSSETRGVPRASALLKRRSPCHDEALRTQVAPKLLAEQRLDVGVVVVTRTRTLRSYLDPRLTNCSSSAGR
jgi:hypothetical protein